MVNETRHYHNDIVTIEGRLFYLYTNISWQGFSVSLKVDGENLSQYTDTTNKYGKFQFDYTIPNSSNIYSNQYKLYKLLVLLLFQMHLYYHQ